jgi:hypothetical protein
MEAINYLTRYQGLAQQQGFAQQAAQHAYVNLGGYTTAITYHTETENIVKSPIDKLRAEIKEWCGGRLEKY